MRTLDQHAVGLRGRAVVLALVAGGLVGSAGAGNPIVHRGLTHTPIDGAILTPDPLGRLVISNLGSSGCDGVSITLGDGTACDDLIVQFDPGSAAQTPLGSTVRMAAIDARGAQIMALTTTNVGSAFSVRPDYNFETPQSVLVEARLAGEVVDVEAITLPIAAPVATIPVDGCVVGPFLPRDGRVLTSIGIGAPGAITLFGSTPVLADEVRVVGEFPGGTALPTMAALELTAADIPQIVVDDEALGIFGHAVRAIDDAHMEVQGGKLKISNLGSSGCDGFSIDLGADPVADGQQVQVSVGIAFGQPTGFYPDGVFIDVSATGVLGGGTGSGLGTLLATSVAGAGGAASSFDITADYAPLGSSTQRVEIYNRGTLVTALAGQSGLLAQVAGVPSGCGKNPPSPPFPFPPPPPCFILHFDDLIDITLPGAGGGGVPGVFVGDELRVLAEGASASIDSLETLEVRVGGGAAGAAGIPELDITSITSEPDPEPWIFGVLHEALGAATFAPAPAPLNGLRVNNIGSSGQDGVRFSLKDAQGYCVQVVWPACDPDDNEGTAFELSVNGEIVNLPAAFANLTFTDIGSEVQLDANFIQPYDVFMQVKVLNDEVVVADYTCPVDGPAARVPESTCFHEFDWFEFGEGHCYRLLLQDPVSVQILQGGPSAIGDEIHICPPIITGDGLRLTDMELFGTNLTAGGGGVTITGGAVQQFDVLNMALGDARFDTCGGLLEVSNIGSSGQDGVRVDLRGEQMGAAIGLIPYLPADLIPIDARVCATGTVADDELPIWVIKTGSGRTEVLPDFSALGSVEFVAEVFSGGTLVGTVAGLDPMTPVGVSAPAGTAASVWPAGVDPWIMWFDPHSPPHTTGWDLRYDGAVDFEVGAVLLSGDTLRVTAVGEVAGDAALTRVALTGTGVPALTVTDVTVVPMPAVCPCDRDGGGVAVGDLLDFLADWFVQLGSSVPSGTGADYDGSGVVNITDLLGFLSCWFPANDGVACP